MRYLMVLVFALLLGCQDSTHEGCMEVVQKRFPGAVVLEVPEQPWEFIVIEEDGSVWWIENRNQDNSISSSTILAKPGTAKPTENTGYW